MRDSQAAEARPYHHGDLSRALIDAARRLLEAEGPSALSLRAVAREAFADSAPEPGPRADAGALLVIRPRPPAEQTSGSRGAGRRDRPRSLAGREA